MKKSNNIKYWIALLIPVFIFSACKEEFLEKPPLDRIVDGSFFKTNEQVMAASALLYNKVWFEYNDKASFNLGDFRAGTSFSAYSDRGSIEFNTTAENSYNNNAWNAFYVVVAQSNIFIQNVNRYAGAQVSPEVKKMSIAEARFMRGVAYRYIVSNWGAAPLIENNLDILEKPLIKRNTVPSIWKFITKDLLAAASDLPETALEKGRVTKWSAEGMLAKVYLIRAGVESEGGVRKQEFLDSAKYYAQRVITLSGAKLLPNYEDLFKVPYDNNEESLFELQWVYTSAADYGSANSLPSSLNFDNSIGNNGDGWGGDKGATLWMLGQYDGLITRDNSGNPVYRDNLGNPIFGKTSDKRLKATFMLPGFSYPEVNQEVEGKLVGLVKANTTGDVNNAPIKKYITGKGTPERPAWSQRYDHNGYMLRLADVYLIYAEAELGNSAQTTDATALQYFNAVHERAGLPKFTAPLTMDAIIKERYVEFAMEGVAWYDLVALHYWNPEKAYNLVSAQDRGLFGIRTNQYPDPTAWAFIPTPWDNNRFFPANSGNFLLPIPSAEITGAPQLKEEPVDYYAGK